jgi:hypothetical protein
MKKSIYIFGLIMLFGLFACEKEIDPGLAPNSTLAGHWTVKEYSLDMEELYGPYLLYTYNTSMDADSIWIDNIYDSGIKMKVGVASETTFEKTGGYDFNNSIGAIATINVSEASIMGDSIIFRVTFFAADGTTVLDDYYEAGHRTTGVGDDTH